ncbi:redoxin domain protein [bacterium 336/3]|jgi:thioredoxin-dependent peroxiredoxin|nr:redoxin domain protein [bacterium 336/3]
MALKLNSIAPNFDLPSTNGKNISLENDLKGKPCIVYFYPKDFTPGCTKEACEFRDQFATFRNLNIDVFGISRDNVETHLKFKEQHKLPFELLSDVDGKVCKSYDALIPIVGIPKRISYLLDAEHKVLAVYQDFFGAEDHIKEMLKKIQTV